MICKRLYGCITFLALFVAIYTWNSEVENKEGNESPTQTVLNSYPDTYKTPTTSYVVPVLQSYDDLIFKKEEELQALSLKDLEDELAYFAKEIFKLRRQIEDLSDMSSAYYSQFRRIVQTRDSKYGRSSYEE